MDSKLLRNATVVSWDEGSSSLKVLPNSSILVVGDEIAAITSNPDGLELPDKTDVLDMTGKILTPGFVNTHCHMWQTAFRSMAPDIFIAQYFVWLSQMGQATASFSPKDIYLSTLEGYLEGLNAGVTSYVDHASTNWRRDMITPSCEAAIDSGARVWWCYDFNTRNPKLSGEEQLETLQQLETRIHAADSQVTMGFAIDGFHLSTDEDVERMKQLARDIKARVLTTHYLGGPWPFVGMTSPTSASDKNLQDLEKPIIFSHGGYSTATDIEALRNHDNFLAITPENEMSEGHGQVTSCSVHDHASLGTDTNWNISGDVLLQARMWLQSVRKSNYQKTLDKGLAPRQNPMSVQDAFLLATRQGGRALHRDDIGVLKVGAKADIVCFNGDSPNMIGWTNAVAAVVLHANVGDIEHVLVGGQFRKQDGKLVTKTKTWEEIAASFAEVARRVQGENVNPPPLPDKFMGMMDLGDVELAKVTRNG